MKGGIDHFLCLHWDPCKTKNGPIQHWYENERNKSMGLLVWYLFAKNEPGQFTIEIGLESCWGMDCCVCFCKNWRKAEKPNQVTCVQLPNLIWPFHLKAESPPKKKQAAYVNSSSFLVKITLKKTIQQKENNQENTDSENTE